MQMNHVYGLKFPPKAGIKLEIARSAAWRLSEAPFRQTQDKTQNALKSYTIELQWLDDLWNHEN